MTEWPPGEAWVRQHALCGGEAGADTITCTPLSGGFVGALVLAKRVGADGRVLESAVVKRAPSLAVPLFQTWRLHAREVAFYNEVAPRLQHAVVPACIHASLEGGVLVLEDLTKVAAAPVLSDGMGEADLAAALRSLASLHAATWIGPDVPTVEALEPLESAAFEPLIKEQLPRFIEALAPHGRALVGAARWDKVAEQLPGLAAASKRSSPPLAVVHGDCWAGNILLGVDSVAAGAAMKAHLVDLQFAAYGHPMADVAMLFASSAELGAVVPDRSAAQRRLLAGYAAELEHCFRLQGDAPPAGTSVEALHVLLGPELASSGLALVVASFDAWWGMDKSPAVRARLAERWAAVCVDAAPYIVAVH